MKKRKALIFAIVAAFLLLLIPMTSLGATEDITTWSAKRITNANKTWTIQFTHPLKESTINSSNVYVEDEEYRYHFTQVSLSSDKRSIIVTPMEPYQEYKTYRLYISSDVASEKGKKLGKTVVQPFSLNGAVDNTTPVTGDAVKSVRFLSKNFATMVNVVSSDEAARVTANGKEMHYSGGNLYSIGLTGLTAGDSVSIQAYDNNGKRIFSRNYTVN